MKARECCAGSGKSLAGKLFRRGAIALAGIAVAAVATIESCSMTRTGDGGITLTFAPDMTITAYGLEDALHQIDDLYEKCLSGTWGRTCTRDELAEVGQAHDRIVKAKGKLLNQ